jgi:hypothetical protein
MGPQTSMMQNIPHRAAFSIVTRHGPKLGASGNRIKGV